MRFGPLLLVISYLVTLCVPLSGAAQETPMPYQASAYAEEFEGALTDIDRFWQVKFQGAGVAYRSATVYWLETMEDTPCGPGDPHQGPGFYCPLNETIYLSIPWYWQFIEDDIDFAWVTVAAHEWGHHVQNLLRVSRGGASFELQADCLAGAYAKEAATNNLLESGDITEAADLSGRSGDPAWLPTDQVGAHGSGDDRLINFMIGYINGVGDCGTPLDASGTVTPPLTPIPPVSPPQTVRSDRYPALPLNTLLPATLSLTHGQDFREYSAGNSTFDDMLTSFSDPEETRRLLLDWGWQENVYRIFTADNPPPGGVGWLEIGIHRFASADGAAAALPFFIDARRQALGYEPVDVGLFSDQSEALSGRAFNGNELMIYARRGNLLFRVAGIAPNGDPTADVFEALLLPLEQLTDEPRVTDPALFAILPDAGAMPPGLALAEEHARSAGTIALTFPNVAEAERLFQTWGWRESAARVFTGSTVSGTSRVEISVFRLANETTAAAALSYFLDARAQALGLQETVPPAARADEVRSISGPVAEGVEQTAYVRRGRDLYRISAIGPGNPMADLASLLARW